MHELYIKMALFISIFSVAVFKLEAVVQVGTAAYDE